MDLRFGRRMRKAITKTAVDQLKVGGILSDDIVRGFVARRLPSGAVSYSYRYSKDGSRRWIRLGIGITPHDARKAALKLAGHVAGDGDPLPERQARRRAAMAARTVNQVLDAFLDERVRGRLRTAREMESLLDRFVRPKLGGRSINALKRSEVVALLDDIARQKSKRSADGKARRVSDKVLSVLRAAFNFYVARDDEFRTPIVKGMSKTTLKELTRKRVLDDGEVRILWRALDRVGPPAYTRLVRTLLLSAARLNEIARLQRSEIKGDVALVPGERTKSKVEFAVPLTPALLEQIGEPAEDSGGFIFSTNHGFAPFSGFSKAKKRVDAEIAKLRAEADLPAMPGWRLHDLRRTARTLMARAKIDSDVAERVLGHALPGIRGVYDCFEYIDEKRDALLRLSALVQSIVSPSPANVVALRPSEAA
jgi:integrase